MSHGITEKDVILRPEESSYNTWHNRDTKVAGAINKEVMEHYGLFSPIREGDVYVRHRGGLIEMPNRKALIADLRHREEAVPLHIASHSYEILQNTDVWQTMELAMDEVDLPHKISCTGSLQSFSKFFISVEIGDGDGFVVNGDRFHGHLNFLTSHNGSLALRILDSIIRVVCANTYQAALDGNKNINFTVRHKKNAKQNAKRIAKHIGRILQGRVRFTEEMEELASVKVADSDIEAVVAGYFLNLAFEKGEKLEDFSTRTRNQIDGIAQLARHGRGNSGQTLYDVWNGVTEYYTSGDGVGKTTSEGSRAYSSEFGTGATRKQELTRYLVRGDYKTASEEAAPLLAV